jgi:ABC-2 type transport system ATP-binding protein
MLLGLWRPTRGDAFLGGERIPATSAQAGVGSMMDTPGLYPWMTAEDNITALTRSSTAREAADRLEIVGLAASSRTRVRHFSHGMKQRLALAVAIANGPHALILDEPTNGLDPAGIHDFRVLVRGLADGGRAVLVASHQLGEIERLCDEVVILNRGRIASVFDLSREASGGPSATSPAATSLEARFLRLTQGDVP